MSWSVDMRCLYCDGKLPLYRKITHGQFCSTAHRKAYWLEQEQLAVERLHQTHNSLRAYRSPVPPETILGPSDPTATALGGFVAEILAPRWSDVASIVVAEAPTFEIDCRPEGPALAVPANQARNIDAAALVALSGTLTAQDCLPRPRVADLGRRDVAIHPCWPSAAFEGSLVVPAAKLLQLVGTRLWAAPVTPPRIVTLSALPPRMPRPTLHWPLTPLAPQQPAERLLEDEVPFSSRLFRLPRVRWSEIRMAGPAGIAAPLDLARAALLLRLDVAPLEGKVPFFSRLLSLSQVPSREIRMAAPVGIGVPEWTVPPAHLLRLDVAPVDGKVPFFSRLLSLPQVPSREIRKASPVGIGAPVGVVPPALHLQRDMAPQPVNTLSGAGLLALEMPKSPWCTARWWSNARSRISAALNGESRPKRSRVRLQRRRFSHSSRWRKAEDTRSNFEAARCDRRCPSLPTAWLRPRGLPCPRPLERFTKILFPSRLAACLSDSVTKFPLPSRPCPPFQA